MESATSSLVSWTMPCHHGGTLQDREELLLKLLDVDEITSILMFLLNPSGDDDETDFYLTEFCATLQNLMQQKVGL